MPTAQRIASVEVDVVDLADASIPLLEHAVREGIVCTKIVDRHLAAAKLAELDDRLVRIRVRCPATVDELRADRDALDLVSFNLMLAVQSCLDIAGQLIVHEGWPAATSLPRAFDRIRDEGVISASTAAALGRAVALRNLVAVGEAGEHPDVVHAAATRGLDDFEAFAREVAKWISTRESERAPSMARS